MFKRSLIALLTAALVPVASGCDDETPAAQTGDLQVTYRVGSGSSTCEDVGIEFVRVYISISETEDLVDQIFACEADSQSVTFTDVAVGTYSIRIEGLSAANSVIYAGAASQEVTIVADRTNGPVSVVLNQLRPAMQIFFGFSDVGGCDRFGVVDLVVRIYENGSSLVHDETYECATQINESLLIEGLSDTSTYDLRVRGTNDNSEYTHEYNEDDITVAPGEPTVISAEMDACTGLCDEP